MTQVNGQIYLIMFGNVYDWFLVLHVYSHKLVANLWCMFSIVNYTELLVSNIIFHFWIILQFNTFTFNLFTPSVLVQALSEEDHVSKNNLVIILIDSVAHSVEIQSKNFINQHFLSVIICQQIVVSLPLWLTLSSHFMLHISVCLESLYKI